MNRYLKLIENKRQKLLDLTKNLTVEQYNFIPNGFNNNIIWNMGHLLSVSERILYEESGLQPPAHSISLAMFNKGTKPEKVLKEEEIAYIRDLMLESVRFLEKCEPAIPETGSNDYQSSETNTKLMEFVLFHEEYHYCKTVDFLRNIHQLRYL